MAKCNYCNEEFERKNQEVYCSSECKSAAISSNEKICEYCNKMFLGKSTAKYCSDSCREYAFYRNKKDSESTEPKKQKGFDYIDYAKEQISHHFGDVGSHLAVQAEILGEVHYISTDLYIDEIETAILIKRPKHYVFDTEYYEDKNDLMLSYWKDYTLINFLEEEGYGIEIIQLTEDHSMNLMMISSTITNLRYAKTY